MKIELLGINVQRNPGWDRHFTIMGFGDIGLPEMQTTLRGCALARKGGQIIALPPKVPGARPGDLGGIQWDINGTFATAVCDTILAGYEKMGGQMPPALTEAQRNGANAARRYAEKGAAAAAADDDDSGQDDDSGLGRLLGVGDAE